MAKIVASQWGNLSEIFQRLDLIRMHVRVSKPPLIKGRRFLRVPKQRSKILPLSFAIFPKGPVFSFFQLPDAAAESPINNARISPGPQVIIALMTSRYHF